MTIKCKLCGENTLFVGNHLDEAHPDTTIFDYLDKFPDAPVASQAVYDHLAKRELGDTPARVLPPPPDQLSIKIAGVKVRVNGDVPAEVCLGLPDKYRIPEHGDLADDVAECAVILSGSDDPVWIHGPPGTGKDAWAHAWSFYTRSPALFIQVNQNTDVNALFYRRCFKQGETGYEEGALLKALRDGYTAPSGRKVPYLILMSDFDRADPRRMENMRSTIESIDKRVPGPMGEFYPILEGTRIVFTANSSGGGDETGRCVTSNPVDASFMTRCTSIRFHPMEWEDEESILREKFPIFAQRAGQFFSKIGDFTKVVRERVEHEQINIEFSHRELEKWIRHAEKILKAVEGGAVPKRMLNRSARVAFLDVSHDRATREELDTLMKANIPEDL